MSKVRAYQAVQSLLDSNGGFKKWQVVYPYASVLLAFQDGWLWTICVLFLFMLQGTSTACLGQNSISAATAIRDCFCYALQTSEVVFEVASAML
jgi:hypothetical protein